MGRRAERGVLTVKYPREGPAMRGQLPRGARSGQPHGLLVMQAIKSLAVLASTLADIIREVLLKDAGTFQPTP